MRACVTLLLQYHANPNIPDCCGNIPLHRAARYNDVDTIKELLQYGSDINSIDQDENTPLHRAVSCSHMDSVKTLLENRARCDIKNKKGFTVKELVMKTGIRDLILSYDVTMTKSARKH